MLKNRAFRFLILCLAVFAFSYAAAADRDTGRELPKQTRLSEAQRSVTPGPVTAPRILRDRLEFAVRLMLELVTPETPLPPLTTLGLSDDPDLLSRTS